MAMEKDPGQYLVDELQQDTAEVRSQEDKNDGERDGILQNEDSMFVTKPYGQEKNDENLAMTLLKFIPNTEHAFSHARMPLDVSMAYGDMQSDLMFGLLGGADPKHDAAITMASYHARDGHPFDTAASIARHDATQLSSAQRHQRGLMGLFGGRGGGGKAKEEG